MNTVARIFALTALSLPLAAAAHAATPSALTALTCTGNTGSLHVPVYAYSVDNANSGSRFFTIYTDTSNYRALLVDEFFGSGYQSCTLGNFPYIVYGTSTIEDVTIAGTAGTVVVPATGGEVTTPGKDYVGVTFSYNFLNIGTAPAIVSKTLSPEEKAKALADFKARGLALPRD